MWLFWIGVGYVFAFLTMGRYYIRHKGYIKLENEIIRTNKLCEVEEARARLDAAVNSRLKGA
jgi:hypothetical protein